jgi:hypothetical protein
VVVVDSRIAAARVAPDLPLPHDDRDFDLLASCTALTVVT